MRRSQILLLALGTLVVFPILGFGIAYFLGNGLDDFQWFNEHPLINTIVGLIAGTTAGYGGWWLITRSFMRPALNKYGDTIGSLNVTMLDIIFISFCAGFGEEVLFRGAVQPLLGIWITAVLFVAMHGYLNPFDWRVSIYGAAMTLFIAFFGYLTLEVGLVSAILAHMIVDVVLLKKLQDNYRSNRIKAHEDSWEEAQSQSDASIILTEESEDDAF